MTFSALELLRSFTDELRNACSPINLFSSYPTVCFRPEIEICQCCGKQLKVRKTKIGRLAFTLHIGAFNVHETFLGCDLCGNSRTYRSEKLGKLFPEKCNYGFDVIVHVGRRLFLENQTVRETAAELADKNVFASESEVAFLGVKFVSYLAVAHRRTAFRLREVMKHNGGYMLHIDATCEGGGPMLVSGMDAVTSIVLWNEKIPTEKTDHITHFLQKIKEMYGRPLLVVMDMSNAFEKATREVFGKDIRILICHFHFLRDLGKDLLEKDYDTLRKKLRKHGISSTLRRRLRSLRVTVDEHSELLAKINPDLSTGEKLTKEEMKVTPTLIAYSLIQWVLDGKSDGDAYGFPFDRPLMCFCLRIIEIFRQVESLKRNFASNEHKYNKPLLGILGDVRKIVEDRAITQALDSLQEKIRVFDELRKAMRIAPANGGDGLNDNGNDEPIGKIEERVSKFRKTMEDDFNCTASEGYRKMIDQIDKYWDRLFADPVVLDTPNGTISIQPQRTNNIMEQFFRSVRRSYRRRSGDNSMAKKIKAMKANTLLIKNLKNPQYMEMLLDGAKSIEDVFANIDAEEVRKEMNSASDDVERVPAKVKKMIKMENFPEKLLNRLKKMIN